MLQQGDEDVEERREVDGDWRNGVGSGRRWEDRVLIHVALDSDQHRASRKSRSQHLGPPIHHR